MENENVVPEAPVVPAALPDESPSLDIAHSAAQIGADLFGTPPPEEPPAAIVEPPAEVPVEPPAPEESKVEPPKTWRTEARAEWEKLPRVVQDEIQKREADIFSGIEQYKERAKIGGVAAEVLGKHADTFQRVGANPWQQVDQLLTVHNRLLTGTPEQKQAILQDIARNYGIVGGGVQAQEQPWVDPQVAALQQELDRVKSQLQGFGQSQYSAQLTEVQKSVDAFAMQPDKVFFNEVSEDMARLIETGVASSLEDAYEKAVWQNPVTREKQIARTREAEQRQAAEKAEAAKKAAAANVRSTTKTGGAAPIGSMDDTIRDTLRRLRSS